MSTALAAHVFSRDLLDARGQPRNPWGGDWLVAPATPPGLPAGEAFMVTATGMPASGCIDTAARAAGSGGFYDIQVNGHSVVRQGQANFPVLSGWCNAGGSSNQVAFVMAANTRATGAAGPPQPCLAPAPVPHTRTYTCPSGSLLAGGGSSITQTHLTTYSCGSLTGPLNSSTTPWSPAATCAGACTPHSQPESRTAFCPAGEVTSSNATTFTQSSTKSYTCAGPTGPSTATYTPWTPSASSVCAPTSGSTLPPACVAPPVSLSQTIACPSGHATATAQTSFTQTATRSYSCPSPTGAPQASTSPWSPAGSVACAHVYLPRQGLPGAMSCRATGLGWAQMVTTPPRVQCPSGYTVMVKGLSCPYGPSPGAWSAAGNSAIGNCSFSPAAILLMNQLNHVHSVACPAITPYSTGATWTAACFK